MTFDFPTRNGLWELNLRQQLRLQSLYPNVSVVDELRKALAWLEANPTRRKTDRGMARFLVGWLNKSSGQQHQVKPRMSYRPRATRQAVCPHTPTCASPGNWQCQQRTVLEQARAHR